MNQRQQPEKELKAVQGLRQAAKESAATYLIREREIKRNIREIDSDLLQKQSHWRLENTMQELEKKINAGRITPKGKRKGRINIHAKTLVEGTGKWSYDSKANLWRQAEHRHNIKLGSAGYVQIIVGAGKANGKWKDRDPWQVRVRVWDAAEKIRGQEEYLKMEADLDDDKKALLNTWETWYEGGCTHPESEGVEAAVRIMLESILKRMKRRIRTNG